MDMLADIDRVPSRNGGGLLVGCGRVGFGVFECRGVLDFVYFPMFLEKNTRGWLLYT